MLPRLTRYQLVAFVLLTVIGITYASIQYVNLPRLIGFGRFDVSMELPEAGGIYPNAIVTYRGKEIGKVENVDLSGSGVVVDMSVDSEQRIPVDLTAEVRSTSAIGEQYVDLAPRSAGGPFLEEGTRIPVDRTRTPTDVATLLASVNELVSTIPQDKLNTVIDEAFLAFNGTGQDLQQLIDSTGALLETANENFGPTVQLFEDLQPVLATQQRSRTQIALLTRNLASFTDQTRESDGDIRGVLDKGAPFADEVARLFTTLKPTLPLLLSNLTDVGEVTTAYLDNLRMTLIVFPIATQQVTQINFGYSSPVPNYAALNFKLTVNDPPACTEGFDPVRRDPNDTSVVSADPDLFCKEPLDSPIGVRMARLHPCPPGSPNFGARSPDARGCGFDFQSPEDQAAKRAANIAIQDCVKRNSPQSLGDPFIEAGPDEACFLGDSVPPSREDDGRGDDARAWLWGAGAPQADQPPPPSENAQYLPGTGTASAPGGAPFVVGNVVNPVVVGPPGLGGLLLTPLTKGTV